MVFGQIVIHYPTKPEVVRSDFMQRETNAPNHAADELAARSLSIQNPSCAEHAGHSRNVNLPQVRIHVDLSELRAERKHGEPLIIPARRSPASAKARMNANGTVRVEAGARLLHSL
jgi:hypothetical protein